MKPLALFPNWLVFGAMVILGGAFVIGLLLNPIKPYPSPNVSVANGTYANAQGGTVVLLDGLLSAGDQTTTYIVAVDKMGPYVMADQRLILEANGAVRVGARQDLMKSHLDRLDSPSKIAFWMWRSTEGGSPYRHVFERRAVVSQRVR